MGAPPYFTNQPLAITETIFHLCVGQSTAMEKREAASDDEEQVENDAEIDEGFSDAVWKCGSPNPKTLQTNSTNPHGCIHLSWTTDASLPCDPSGRVTLQESEPEPESSAAVSAVAAGATSDEEQAAPVTGGKEDGQGASGEEAAGGANSEGDGVERDIDAGADEGGSNEGEAPEEATPEVEAAPLPPPRKRLQAFEVPTSGHFWLHDDRFEAGDPANQGAEGEEGVPR
jgi:hypothetical protein